VTVDERLADERLADERLADERLADERLADERLADERLIDEPLPLRFSGRCIILGDNVAVDGDLMPLRFVLVRETRLDVLREFAGTGLDPQFPAKVRRGDVIVAGRRFAQGNPHIQGLLGLRALGVGLIVESIQRGSLRNAVNAGLPVLPRCPGVRSLVSQGDLLDVDFATGVFFNRTTGIRRQFDHLPAFLLDIIRIGGWEAAFRRRLARQDKVQTQARNANAERGAVSA
jgi:3-isopropylmalate/(R)-2-methylmalate dehydratase small subunit